MTFRNLAITTLATLFLVGCGSSDSGDVSYATLPSGKVFVFFDNNTGKQYRYDTDKKSYEDMNSDTTKIYDMTGKNGKVYTWDHEINTTTETYEQKIVMLHDDYTIGQSLPYTEFHYLAHLHEETNGTHTFAAHSNTEFNPANNDVKKDAALATLNTALKTHAEVKQEIANVLPSGETLCNFYVLGHEDHDENAVGSNEVEEKSAHIALTDKGTVRIYKDSNITNKLEENQSSFSLDGVSACTEDKSSIIKNDEDGVMIYSADSQTLYLLDSHGKDFHVHSSWKVSQLLPAGFTPTQMGGTGEAGEHVH
ncbi:MAG: Unknown protein [uncultured Sulfurovum sp.]|uniref:Lipoprotein n=1 Tax=uncultured Sulfurovum sp. TaxID=269237 RepID=A0A6S6S279_9BACT|nr:MAG: Unknown protein [uncultured Sulfurovum sp.]